MDNDLQAQLTKLMARILDVTDESERIRQEQFQKPEDLTACIKSVDDTVAAYEAILAQVPEEDRRGIGRRYGRQILALRQDTGWLPRQSHGDSVPLAKDTQWERVDELPLPSADAPRLPLPPPRRRRVRTGPSVGDEVEAWCGACKGPKTHNIVAMVGDEPKQVLCRACGARHGFRTAPARKRKSVAEPVRSTDRAATKQRQHKQQRKEDERSALFAELDAATDVREFSKRVRYRTGDIIEHPEHGRGKIEHVAKGSLLVRFRAGVRSLSTI